MTEPERQLSTLLRDTTSGLTPDVAGLVRGGIARGRRVARRRRTGTMLVAAAVAGIIGTAAGLLPLVSGGTGAVGGDKVVASDPTQPVKPTEPTRPPRRDLAVAPAAIPDTFGEIFPGDITEPPQKEPASPARDFLWNGFSVRVAFDPFKPAVTKTPMERCWQFVLPGQRASCVPGRDGSAVRTLHYVQPAADGGVTLSTAWVFTADGWGIFVVAANAADNKDSPILADDAPFTPEQLLQVAQSDIWFKQP